MRVTRHFVNKSVGQKFIFKIVFNVSHKVILCFLLWSLSLEKEINLLSFNDRFIEHDLNYHHTCNHNETGLVQVDLCTFQYSFEQDIITLAEQISFSVGNNSSICKYSENSLQNFYHNFTYFRKISRLKQLTYENDIKVICVSTNRTVESCPKSLNTWQLCKKKCYIKVVFKLVHKCGRHHKIFENEENIEKSCYAQIKNNCISYVIYLFKCPNFSIVIESNSDLKYRIINNLVLDYSSVFYVQYAHINPTFAGLETAYRSQVITDLESLNSTHIVQELRPSNSRITTVFMPNFKVRESAIYMALSTRVHLCNIDVSRKFHHCIGSCLEASGMTRSQPLYSKFRRSASWGITTASGFTTERNIFTGFTTQPTTPPPPPPDFYVAARGECHKTFCTFLISYKSSFNFTRISMQYRDGIITNHTISLKLNITTGVPWKNFYAQDHNRTGFIYTIRGLSGRRRYFMCVIAVPLAGVGQTTQKGCESFMTGETDGETDVYNLTGIFLVLGISTIIMTVVLVCVGYEKFINRKRDDCVDYIFCRYKRKPVEQKKTPRGTISPEPLVVETSHHGYESTDTHAYVNDNVSMSSTIERRY